MLTPPGRPWEAGAASQYGPLLAKWREIQEIIERELRNCLDRMTSDCPPRLREAIGYSLLSEGKRFRPVLAMLAGDAVEAASQSPIPAACALEMIHAYSLIHDDLPAMDDDDLRRGRPTCHRQFDEATAILAGDALQTLAFETLVRDVPSANAAGRMIRCLAHAAGPEGMVGGQMDDLLAEHLAHGGPAMLEAIHRRKTGCIIQAAASMGGIAAGGNDLQVQALANFGAQVGVVFQIVDDILDVIGTSESVGKRTMKDSERGKLTYPGLFGLEKSRTMAIEITEKAIETIESSSLRTEFLVPLARFILHRSF